MISRLMLGPSAQDHELFWAAFRHALLFFTGLFKGTANEPVWSDGRSLGVEVTDSASINDVTVTVGLSSLVLIQDL